MVAVPAEIPFRVPSVLTVATLVSEKWTNTPHALVQLVLLGSVRVLPLPSVPAAVNSDVAAT